MILSGLIWRYIRNHKGAPEKSKSYSSVFGPLPEVCGSLDGLLPSKGPGLSLEGPGFAEGGLLALNPGCRVANLREPSNPTFCECLKRILRYKG